MRLSAILSLLGIIVTSVKGFMPVSRHGQVSATVPRPLPRQEAFFPTSIHRQRKSVANIQLTSLFGLGAPEIAIIFLVTVFLLGPEKISEMIRQSGKVAGELKEEFKEVPAEFKKGLEEGETESRAKKARPIEPVKDDYEK